MSKGFFKLIKEIKVFIIKTNKCICQKYGIRNLLDNLICKLEYSI